MTEYLSKCATNCNVSCIGKLFSYRKAGYLHRGDEKVCYKSLDHTDLSQLSKSRDLIEMIPAPAWQKSAISHSL